MDFNFEAITQAGKDAVGKYRGGLKGVPRVHAMADDFLKATGSGGGSPVPRGFGMVNRNSAIGSAHGVLKVGMEQLMGKSASGYAATGLMAAGGLGAAAGINSFNSNHPGATPFTAGAGILAVGAAAIDPALLGKVFSSGAKIGEKAIGKMASEAPGAVKVSATIPKVPSGPQAAQWTTPKWTVPKSAPMTRNMEAMNATEVVGAPTFISNAYKKEISDLFHNSGIYPAAKEMTRVLDHGGINPVHEMMFGNAAWDLAKKYGTLDTGG